MATIPPQKQNPSEPIIPNAPKAPAPTTPRASVSPAPVGSSNQVPKGKKTGLVITFVIIILLILGAGGYYWYKHHKTTKKVAVVVTKQDIPLIRNAVFENPVSVFPPTDDNSAIANSVNEQIFEGLVTRNGEGAITPLLATSWKNPNDTTWVFNLKPNVKFQDGNAFTAADVVSSIDQYRKNDNYTAILTDTIKTATATNPTTVTIVTDGPDALLLNRMARLYVIDSKAATTVKAYDKGTGPYHVKAGTTPSDDEIDLVAKSNYHGGHIYTKAVNFIYYPEPEQSDGTVAETNMIKDLKSNKVDIAGFFTGDRINQIAQNHFYKYATGDLGVVYFGFNTVKKGPLQNLKVRQAIYETVSPQAMAKAAERENIKLTAQPVPEEIPGYNPDIKRPAINIAHAKQLLTEAGYPNGTTIEFAYHSSLAPLETELAKELKQIGITLTPKIYTDAGTFFDDVDAGKLQFWYATYSTDLFDSSDVISNIFTSDIYSNPTATNLVTEANSTLLPDKHIALLQQANKTLMADVPIIPLYSRVNTWAMNKPFVMNPNYNTGELATNFWQVYQKSTP